MYVVLLDAASYSQVDTFRTAFCSVCLREARSYDSVVQLERESWIPICWDAAS